MRKLFLLVLLAAAAYYSYSWQLRQSAQQEDSPAPSPASVERANDTSNAGNSSDALERAYGRQQSNVQVHASGVVSKILSDDSDGSRHQRFIVRLPSGHTVLIAHNIDLAPRVAQIAVGDKVQFNGEYEWNNKGGVVHWTHRDPAGRHIAGWIKHHGQTYQ